MSTDSVCKACSQAFLPGVPYTKALGAEWHKDCFNCAHCHAPFPDRSFYNFDGRPYCSEQCGRNGPTAPGTAPVARAPAPASSEDSTCAGCKKHIDVGVRFTRACGKVWHKETCFKCQTCDKFFENNQFYELSGLPFCSQECSTKIKARVATGEEKDNMDDLLGQLSASRGGAPVHTAPAPAPASGGMSLEDLLAGTSPAPAPAPAPAPVYHATPSHPAPAPAPPAAGAASLEELLGMGAGAPPAAAPASSEPQSLEDLLRGSAAPAPAPAHAAGPTSLEALLAGSAPAPAAATAVPLGAAHKHSGPPPLKKTKVKDVCYGCDAQIKRTEPAITAMDADWHEACFKCNECAKPCAEQFIVWHDMPFCSTVCRGLALRKEHPDAPPLTVT